MPFELCLFWVPLAGTLALTALAGHQIHSAAAMPASLSPAFLLCGALLVFGAVVGIFKPSRLVHWLSPSIKLRWWPTSQYLFALVFGALLVAWAVMSLLRHAL